MQDALEKKARLKEYVCQAKVVCSSFQKPSYWEKWGQNCSVSLTDAVAQVVGSAFRLNCLSISLDFFLHFPYCTLSCIL